MSQQKLIVKQELIIIIVVSMTNWLKTELVNVWTISLVRILV